MTGRFPAELGIHHEMSSHERNLQYGNVDFLDPAIPTITQVLKNAGYVTAHFGKWHLSTDDAPDNAPHPWQYGIDHYTSLGELQAYDRAALDDRIVDRAIEFIDEHTRNSDAELAGKPFFLNAWFLTPHAVLNPTKEQTELYANLSSATDQYTSTHQVYYASITALDTAIGRLIDYLDAAGLRDQTIIIFTSDNGPEGIYANSARHSGIGSPGPFRGRKRSLYEGGIRVPLIVSSPSYFSQGEVNDASIVSAVDFLPTFAELAGTSVPCNTALDGESFADVLTIGITPARQKPLYWEWRWGDLDDVDSPIINKSPMMAIRMDNWKLLMTPPGNPHCDGEPIDWRVEMYDLERDLTETHNRFGGSFDIMWELRDQVVNWWSTLPSGPCDKNAGMSHYRWPGSFWY